MNYQQFESKIIKVLKETIGERGRIEKVQLTRNNMQCSSISVFVGDETCSPVFPLNDLYNSYWKGETIEEIVERIVRECESVVPNEFKSLSEEITNFEEWRDKIFILLVKASGNEEYYKNIVTKDFLDLKIIYYIRLPFGENGISAVIKIPEHVLDIWKINKDRLHDIAMENCRKFDKPKVYDVMGMKVLGNESRNCGASSILFTEYLEKLSKEFGGDFYIIPSSIHEIIAMPMVDDKESINSIIEDVNTIGVKGEEVLSNHVYIYNAQMKRIEY